MSVADPFPAQPAVLPPGPWQFPTPRRTALDNGLQVVTYTLPGQYVIAGHLVLDIPLSVEERAAEGTATIAARCLDEGSGSHPGEEFAELLETEGAGFGVDVTLAGTQVVLDVPASRLGPALDLFAEAVTEPALEPADVDRHVQLRLAEIEQAEANSAHLASIAFRRAVFDPESRASRMSGGEADTVAAVDTELARAFHADHVGPVGATLVLAGAFGDDPLPLVERAFADWRPQRRPRPEPGMVAAAPRRLLVVDRPGSVQADVRLGGFGIDRTSPLWAPATVACYAMGGAFLSRLNGVLREEKGFTYGVRLGLNPLRAGGSFAVQGSFRTEVVAESVEIALELLDVAGRPFSDAEVTEAVTYFAGVSPLRYATADGVADQAAANVLVGLADDYVDRFLAAIAAVTPAAATSAYAELVRPRELSLVVVGDAARLAEPLRALGLGELDVVSTG